jgi:hypothetical protein
VGVVVSKLDAIMVASVTRDIPQNVNFAIKGSVATNFLDARAVGYATGAAGSGLGAADIAERARRFTVRVECYR